EIWGGAPQANAVGEYSQYRAWWMHNGQPLGPEDWALARAVLKGETSAGEVIRIARFDGGTAVLLNAAAPIRDEHGNITGAVATVDDITEQLRLADANLELKEASRRKSAFVSYLSHELRTPLNAILGFSELLHDEVVGPVSDVQREVLADVLSSGRHLLPLLDDVLDTARIEAGKLELRLEPVDLSALLADVDSTIRPIAGSAHVTLDMQPDPGVHALSFEADVVRLRQVLYNFLSNAIKFTPPGGCVSLQVRRTVEGMLRFAVADTGIGIAVDDQRRLFVDFEQVNGTTHGGWGLGLALTRRLVEAHHGRVGVESAIGKGSTFWADFPLTRA
ncbi:MAG: ATP-binding protein, partial [Gammaproteobacteria bacterium]